MADLANPSVADARYLHAPYIWGADELVPVAGVAEVPVGTGPSGSNPAMLERGPGPARPQSYGASYGYGMTDPYPFFTGAHGLIPDHIRAPGMVGGQESWRSWNPRTMRHEPNNPWDEGITQGAA